MPTSRKNTKKKSPREVRRSSGKKSGAINPRAPWKASWYVIWGFLTVIGELILIFLVKGKVVSPSTVQVVVIFICIPIITHLLVSAFRTILIAISTR